MEIDAKKCIANIKHLLNQQGRKMKDLEENVGISSGYLAKIANQNKSEWITVELTNKIANYLEVSADALLYFDYSKSDEAEKKAMQFLLDTKDATISGRLKWRQIYNKERVKSAIAYVAELSNMNGVEKSDIDFVSDIDNQNEMHIIKHFYVGKTVIEIYVMEKDTDKTIVSFNSNERSKELNDQFNNTYKLIIDASKLLFFTQEEEKQLDYIAYKLTPDKDNNK